MSETRQLAAVMFTDIVGYTAMMQEDEKAALEKINRFKEVLELRTPQFNGKIIQYYGDGCLILFNSSIDSLNLAKHMQIEFSMELQVPVRVGIHMGDVVLKDGNVYGDVVNISSRIQALAPTGGIYISEVVYNNAVNKKEFEFEFVTRATLKNVQNPVLIYKLLTDETDLSATPGKISMQKSSEKSIAVLPFVNFSSDPEQEYFSDGLTEEIITDLSHIHSLRVISRTSVMLLKNTQKDIRTIGQQLSAKYLLEGSVRKSGNKIRITAQLIDAEEDVHLWADKYEGTMEDIFDLQEDVSRKIVAALNVNLTQKEDAKITERPIQDVDAYELYLKARYELFNPNPESLARAMKLVEDGLEIIGRNPLLLATKGQIQFTSINMGLRPDPAYLEELKNLITEIFSLDAKSTHGLFLSALVSFIQGKSQEAINLFKQLLAINPNHRDVLFWSITLFNESGYPEKSLPLAERLMKIDPLTPFNGCLLGFTQFCMGKNDKAALSFEMAHKMDPTHPFILLFYATILFRVNQVKVALELIAKLEFFPSTTILPHFGRFLKSALLGHKEEALASVNPQLVAQAKWSANMCFQMASVYSLLKEKKEMLYWIDLGMKKGFLNYPVYAFFDPVFETFHTDPDFQQLINAIKVKKEQLEV
jgi:TolB-like protein/class 3 adenylate cyclase